MTDALTERYLLKLSPAEKAELAARAREDGVPMAVLLRTGWRYMPRPKETR